MMSRNVDKLKKIVWAVCFGAMISVTIPLTACGSKETVLLEEEDLVQTEDARSYADGEMSGVSADAQRGASGDTDGVSAEEQTRQEGKPEDAAAVSTASQMSEEQVEISTLFVHICGEVVNPGVYELPVGSRIYEVVEAAGGFTEDAWESYVNLAQVLEDGCKIEIPAVGFEEAVSSSATGVTSSAAGITSGAAGVTSSTAGVTGSTAGITGTANIQQENLIDINTATKAQLCTLPGIGESRAESIIAYREKNGEFSKIEDIMEVEGIKEGMFGKLKDMICVRGVK